MTGRLPWILLAASLLLNVVFLAGATFGWTGQKTALLAGPSAMAEVTKALSLTPEQTAALEALRQDIASRRGESRGARRGALLAALAADDFDRAALETAMAERSSERRVLFADMAEELHAYLQNLSPEQRERFLELAAERGFLRKLLFDGKSGRGKSD